MEDRDTVSPGGRDRASFSSTVQSIEDELTGNKHSKTSPQRRISKSISNLKPWKSSKRDSNTPDVADITEMRPDYGVTDDLGKSKYMMKSIVGLLTTASVYAEMENAHEANDFGQELTEGDRTDQHHDEGGECGDRERITNLMNRNKNKNRTKADKSNDQNLRHSELRKPTLFDFKVVPTSKTLQSCKQNNHSKHQVQNILAEKLLKHFTLDRTDTLLKEFSAWLLKDVLLQGKIFLTSLHLLFFAYLPKSPGTIKMNGNLTIRSSLRGSSRYWCILKDHTLTLYNSPTEVYFPVLTIDLRNATNIRIVKKAQNEETKEFKIITTEKTFSFTADSELSARTWVNAIKKQQFAANNAENNSVSLKIPLANIVDLEGQLIADQTLSLRIKALESLETFAIDDFFFVFLDGSGCSLKNSVKDQITTLKNTGVRVAYKTSNSLSKTDSRSTQSLEVIPNEAGSSELQPSCLDPKDPSLPGRQSSNNALDSSTAIANDASKSKEGRSWRRGLRRNSGDGHAKLAASPSTSDEVLIEHYTNELPEVIESSLQMVQDIRKDNDSPNEDGGESRRARIAGWTTKPFKHMAEMWSGNPIHYRNDFITFSDDDPFLIPLKENLPANDRFRQHFKLNDDETLLSAYFTYFTRSIPLYGKVYVANGMICFRTLLPRVNTKMVLPLSDVETCYKEKGFRFGYLGLVIVIRGHEELFFEFSTEASRDDLEFILLKQLDFTKSKKSGVLSPTASVVETDSSKAKLKFFEDRINAEGFEVPLMIDENPYFQTNIVPCRSYKIGMLTIGSRGDVQPYVALGKGLIKEGHQVTIITHCEFKDFVESHGIGFEEIAGNPAELMSLMVEHESMNVGLLRDASTRFRDWITELLDSSWKTCSKLGLDILIESPSAMAGIHIVEALEIPYFRAFTMPWTKTRAYPHAFIVPDQKRGGNYNYLTHVLFENIFWKGISGQVNKWRVETLGLEKTNLDLLQQSKVPFFYNVSPTIFPPSVDFSEWTKVTGYWFLDEKLDYQPPESLVKFIADAKVSGRKIVYVGFGSIVVSNAKEMTKAIAEAVQEADVFCILNKGWSERLEDKKAMEVEVELPDCIYNAGSVPHDWLFPQMDAAVHHGGSGTTGASLRAGLPTIIKPFFGDQFFYALRVEDIGAGIALKQLNTSSLAAALKEVSTNKRIQDKACSIKKQIANEDGVKTAINCLYGELVYARSLVLSKSKKASASNTSILKNLPAVPVKTLLDESWTLL